jgi:hypothetical protein
MYITYPPLRPSSIFWRYLRFVPYLGVSVAHAVVHWEGELEQSLTVCLVTSSNESLHAALKCSTCE